MMSACNDTILASTDHFFTFREIPSSYFFDPIVPPDEWERLWDKTLEVCVADRGGDELEGVRLAEDIIALACTIACDDELKNEDVDMELGVEGYFRALDRDDSRRAVTLISMLREKVRRREEGVCPFDLVRRTGEMQRQNCMFKRRQERDAGYSLAKFYEEFPEMRPSWWPRSQQPERSGGGSGGSSGGASKPQPRKSGPAKQQSFAEWMDGWKRAERGVGASYKKAQTRRRAPPKQQERRREEQQRAGNQKRSRFVFVDDEAEEEEEEEEGEDEIEEEEEDEEAVPSPPRRRRLYKTGEKVAARRGESAPAESYSSSASGHAPVPDTPKMRNGDIRNFFSRSRPSSV
eukprot:jgi/Mesvir1/18603/Mv17112-RA.1